MNATLPPMPHELLQTWSSWRHPKQELPTPPMSASMQRRCTVPHIPQQAPEPEMQINNTTTLPPITHFDRHYPRMSLRRDKNNKGSLGFFLATPSYTDDACSRQSPSSSRLPAFQDTFPDMLDVTQPENLQPIPSTLPPHPPHVLDWLDYTRAQSAHYVAEKTCEMICYIWFSSPSLGRSHSPSSPYGSRSESVNALQLNASPEFSHFMQKLLETTQVSQSVIVLSLHYIYRLKEGNYLRCGQPGSEFRIAVAALMMANKFLDDNTYTNKTWSEVSGIKLEEINKMEMEFLAGVQYQLYVDKASYDAWLNLLKGLVSTKNIDSHEYRRARPNHRTSRPSAMQSSVPRAHAPRRRSHPQTHRARSTSPSSQFTYPFSFYMPPAPNDASHNYDASPAPQPGSKRSARDAFSPTSASFPERRPSKRPTPMTLQIPQYVAAAGGSGSAHSSSPLESLQSLANMSLGSSPHDPRPSSTWMSSNGGADPQTLVAAYRAEERAPSTLPQNLYFYSLACSPTESTLEAEEESRWRKTRLRSYQPPPPALMPYYQPPPQPSYPMNIQSASASPHDVRMTIAPPSLPHFRDMAWRAADDTSPYEYSPEVRHLAPVSASPVPSAPFANAGPPGVQFYATPVHRDSAVNNVYDWSRGRRL
ncbi:hypothetical protein PLICRDRAFT_31192 [Plicaturopsis crispa FD-325 SS-3]|nr:hypothetical protein PLICRDRAFT_31192 [Plicaturopsis crispa FD-325 SS-3]